MASSRSAALPSNAWPSGSARRRSSPTTDGSSTRASRCSATTLPDGIRLSYAVKANPMPAVVQHLSPARRLLRRRVGPRDAYRARHFDARDADQLRGARQDPGRAVAGRRRRRHGDPGIENGGGAGHLRSGRGSASGHAWPFGSTRTFASRARACGWAAGRSSSESTRSRCRSSLGDLSHADVDILGFHVFAGSQNLDAEIISEAQRATVELVLELAAIRPRPDHATSISAVASGSRTSTVTRPSTSVASARTSPCCSTSASVPTFLRHGW